MMDNNISAELAATHERELKRFLAICIIYQEPIGMRGAVDELWHTFIMFTKNYASFCKKFLDILFIILQMMKILPKVIVIHLQFDLT